MPYIITNAKGDLLGSTSIGGSVYDENYELLGNVYPTGIVFAACGSKLGSASKEGELKDTNEQDLGKITPNGHVLDKEGAMIGEMTLGIPEFVDPIVAGGACILLFFHETISQISSDN